MARSKSSKRWLKEHFDDPYVKQAQAEGLRSRACYKLDEMQQKYRLIRPGQCVVDLGAAPGGWSQLAARWMRGNGQVIALDLLEMEPLQGVDFLQGDFTEDGPLEWLRNQIGDSSVDLVMSDMAPNMSGVAAVDQAKAMYLAELALEFVKAHLKPGGDFVVKLFQGADFDGYVKEVRTRFDKVQVKKPKASRPRSREVYLLARGHQVE